jgi:hypothetical protein
MHDEDGGDWAQRAVVTENEVWEGPLRTTTLTPLLTDTACGFLCFDSWLEHWISST